jgi:hypothetical protein
MCLYWLFFREGLRAMDSPKIETKIQYSRTLVTLGFRELQAGFKDRANYYFRKALANDPYSEVALLWCARLSSDAFEARVYLRRLLNQNPRHELGLYYYELAEKHCSEKINTETSEKTSILTGRTGQTGKLGESLVSMGLLSELQLNAAQQYQACMEQEGQSYGLGSILMEFGYISAAQLVFAMEAQGHEI